MTNDRGIVDLKQVGLAESGTANPKSRVPVVNDTFVQIKEDPEANIYSTDALGLTYDSLFLSKKILFAGICCVLLIVILGVLLAVLYPRIPTISINHLATIQGIKVSFFIVIANIKL